MADGWDLHAVVSGCTAAASSSSARTATLTVNCQTNKVEDPLTDLASLTFTDDDDDITPFYKPGSGDNSDFEFQGLEEIYRSYNHLKPLPNNPSTISQQQTQLPQPPPPPQKMVQQLISTPGQLIKNSSAGSSLTLPGVRSRRRKNQQTKLVRQMTHEELLSDSWAWRKYGQKPIKGSPYPRNYYRCSTSKGCGARKQVEKSPSDPDIFIVSYSGEHTHPRPTHRNSLAGTTRTKFSSRPSTPATVTSSDPPSSAAVPNPPCCSSSSPVSPSSLSPSTPLAEGESNQRETIEIVDDEEEMEEAEYDEDIDLIPNAVMSEDILKGFEELRRASLSRWTQNSSAAGSGGGGCC